MHRGGRWPITGLSGISQGAALGRGLLELARAPPPLRATVRSLGGEFTAAAATPRSSRIRIHAQTLARGSALVRTLTLRPCRHLRARGRRPGGCGALRCQRRPRSGKVERPAGPGRALAARRAWRGPGLETSRREVPCASWRCSGRREAPGTVLGAPGLPQALSGRPRSSLPLSGVGGIRSRGGRRQRASVCTAPRPSWQLQRSGADSVNATRRFSVSTTCFL